jgi:hypothetical protein
MWEGLANDVFRNRQRTSTRSGILKAEAVYRFAKALQKFGIDTFADTSKIRLGGRMRESIANIPGQGSGLTFKYFLMLAGHSDLIKPDRMVTDFVADALSVRSVPSDLAESLILSACQSLRVEFPELTPALLDSAIWKHQREGSRKPRSLRTCWLVKGGAPQFRGRGESTA